MRTNQRMTNQIT